MKLEKKRNSKIIDIKECIAIVIAIVVVLPIIIASAYTVISTDDFSMMGTTSDLSSNIFLRTIQRTVETWLSWAGGWSANFVQILFSELMKQHFEVAVYYVVISNILLIVALYFFICSYCKYIGIETHGSSIYGWTLVIVTTFGFFVYQEVFYWFVGSTAVILPILYFCMAFGLLFQSQKKNGIGYKIGALLFLLLLGGSALQVNVFGWCLYVYLIFRLFLDKKKPSIFMWVGFIVLTFGTLSSGLAPGNYSRHGVIDSTGVHVFSTAFYTFRCAVQVIMRECDNPLFILMIVLAIYYGKAYGKHDNSLLKIVLNAIAVYIGIMALCFPVLLGYSSHDLNSIANRSLFIVDIYCNMMFLLLFYDVGDYVGGKIEDSVSQSRYRVFLATLAILVIYRGCWLNNSFYGTTTNLGEIRAYSQYIYALYDEIEQSTEANVELEYKMDCPDVFFPFQLMGDSNHWINRAIQGYYGKESVLWKVDSNEAN